MGFMRSVSSYRDPFGGRLGAIGILCFWGRSHEFDVENRVLANRRRNNRVEPLKNRESYETAEER